MVDEKSGTFIGNNKETVLRLREARGLMQQSWDTVAKIHENRLVAEENRRGKEGFGVFHGTGQLRVLEPRALVSGCQT